MKAPDSITLMLVGLALFLLLGDGGGIVGAPPPIAAPGFNVLIVEETSTRDKLPADQKEMILASDESSIRAYVKSKGGDFRVLDQAEGIAELEVPAMKEAHRLPRSTIPWIVASNGKTGFSKPLPTSKAETLAELQKLGGGK